MPSVALAIYQLPGTNALDVAERRPREDGPSCKKRFPDGLDYGIGYDTTPFIRESVDDVVKTLLERWCWWRSWCWSSCRTGGRP